MTRAILLGGILVLFVTTPFLVSAQLNQSFPGPSDNLSLRISPSNPNPDEQVRVSLVGVDTDLGNIPITWFVDGAQVASGRGETSISFTAPSLGDSSSVRAVANTPQFGTVEKTLSITPSEVDLLWEARDAYTPPFYKGKALPASQGIIRITAIPHLITPVGRKLGRGNARYTWIRDFRRRDFNAQSGFGSHTLTYKKRLLDDTDRMTVEVSSTDGSVRGDATVIIPAFTPGVLFYEDHPLYGVRYNRSFTNTLNLTTQETVLVAEPYHFSTQSADSVEYEWESDGGDAKSDEGRPNAITLIVGNSASGQTNLSVSVSNPDFMLQYARNAINLVFGEGVGQSESFLFGQ